MRLSKEGGWFSLGKSFLWVSYNIFPFGCRSNAAELFVFRTGYQKCAEVVLAARGNMENRGKLADGKSPIGKA